MEEQIMSFFSFPLRVLRLTALVVTLFCGAVSQATPPTYTVTYDGNNNTSGSYPYDNNNYTSGATVIVQLNENLLTRAGYLFAGWNTATNGTGISYAADGNTTFTMGATNVILYARWLSLYTVTYDGNKNTGGSAPSDNNTYTNGATVPVVLNGALLTRIGYLFAGWNTATNGTGISYAADGNTTFTMGATNVILYARWTPTFPDTGAEIIFAATSGNTLNLSWPANYIGWELQSNSVNMGITNAWYVVPGSTTTNVEIITIDPKQPNVYFRMHHP